MKKSTPFPSEAEILDFIRTSPGAAGKREIARAFNLTGAKKLGLKQLLKDMERRGQLDRKHKTITAASQMRPVTTLEIIGIDDDGEVFGIPESWEGEAPRVLIRASTGHGADTRPPRPGDLILARIEALTGDASYPYAARPMKNLSGHSARALGVLRHGRNGSRLISIDKKSKRDLDVLASSIGEAEDGELVTAELVRDRGRGHPVARVTARHGDVADPRNVSLIAIQQHGIPNAFSQKVVDDAEALKTFARAGREDLRSLPLITIDPADARDHDDAVHARLDDDQNNEGGHIVTVAIADVAAYVRPQSALDREARYRGNSTYFPDRVVPMLPERISNDLCSLRENEERPALAVVITFDRFGNKKKHRFHRVIMKSVAKLSYEEAQAAIDQRPSEVSPMLRDNVLRPLWAAYEAVSKARQKRSPLELNLPERRLRLDASSRVSGVYVPVRLDAHRLIEEFMIQANVAAAEELERRSVPLLYRVHDEPSKEKMRALASFLKTLGLNFAIGQVLSTQHFNRLLAQAEGKDFQQTVHEVVLRSQAQANYTPENLGHFGLSLSRYAHFTSPIRRYADLVVHRALITALGFGDDGLSEQDKATLSVTAEMTSASERRSALAERDTIDRMVAAFLAGQTGSTFSGRISGVVGVGLFVKLDESGADGFVPASMLGHGYFKFDEARHALIGPKGVMFQLGDSVSVRLLEATPVKGGLRFCMVSDGKKPPTRKKALR